MLGGMPHLEGVFKNSDKLFDLAIVKKSSRDPALGSKTLEEVYPLGPFSVFWSLHGSHLRINRDREFILRHEVERAL